MPEFLPTLIYLVLSTLAGFAIGATISHVRTKRALLGKAATLSDLVDQRILKHGSKVVVLGSSHFGRSEFIRIRDPRDTNQILNVECAGTFDENSNLMPQAVKGEYRLGAHTDPDLGENYYELELVERDMESTTFHLV